MLAGSVIVRTPDLLFNRTSADGGWYEDVHFVVSNFGGGIGMGRVPWLYYFGNRLGRLFVWSSQEWNLSGLRAKCI